MELDGPLLEITGWAIDPKKAELRLDFNFSPFFTSTTQIVIARHTLLPRAVELWWGLEEIFRELLTADAITSVTLYSMGDKHGALVRLQPAAGAGDGYVSRVFDALIRGVNALRRYANLDEPPLGTYAEQTAAWQSLNRPDRLQFTAASERVQADVPEAFVLAFNATIWAALS